MWDWLTCKQVSPAEGQFRLFFILINLMIGAVCLFFDINHLWSSTAGTVEADLPMFFFWLIIFIVAARNVNHHKNWWDR
jgi:hypothetical protein